MNKKIIAIIGIIVIAIAALIIILTMGGKLEEVKLPLQIDFLERTVSATIGYPKDKGIELEDAERETESIFKNEKENYKLEINISEDTTYVDNKEYAAKKEGYEELKINDFSGYIVKGDYAFEGKILLEQATEDASIYLNFELRPIDDEGADLNSLYQLSTVQKIFKSIKYDNGENSKGETKAKIAEEEQKNKTSNYGEFATRDRKVGTSDKNGLIFVPVYTSYDNSQYEFSQANDINTGVQSYLRYQGKTSYVETGVVSIEVSVFPENGTYKNMEEYMESKGKSYTWSKTKIAGKEYDTFVFGSGYTDPKFSKDIRGAFMVGDKVVSFSYYMYKEIPNQELGDNFFNYVINNIEYSNDFKK